MILDALHRIADHRQSLTRDEARAVMTEILTGQCTDAQIGALLVALHMKGETVEEIVGFAEAIRAAATPLKFTQRFRPLPCPVWAKPCLYTRIRCLTPAGQNAMRLSIPAALAAMPAARSIFRPQPPSW